VTSNRHRPILRRVSSVLAVVLAFTLAILVVQIASAAPPTRPDRPLRPPVLGTQDLADGGEHRSVVPTGAVGKALTTDAAKPATASGAGVRKTTAGAAATEAVSILLTPAGVQQQQGAGRLHRFQDTTASFTAVLAPDFVALETTGYVDIDDFAGRIATLAAAVAEHYAPAEMQRIGLRFINELRLGSARPKQEMLNAITPALLGPIGTTELADATVSMQQVVVLADADTNMLVRHGYNPEGGTTVDLAPGQILGPEQSQPFYLLDIDAYAEQVRPYSVEGIEARLRDFNEQIRALFAWAVKEEYRKDKLGQVEVVA